MINYDMTGLLLAVESDVVTAEARVARLKWQAAKLGTPVSCDGCTLAGCCYMPTAVFIAEALWIAKHHPVPVGLRVSYIAKGGVMENTGKDSYFHSATPCVYLTPENRCSIYANRPGACRRYNVVNEPKLCMPGQTAKVSVMNTMDIDNDWVTAMVRYQVRYLGAPLEPIMMGALPKLVSIASTALELPNGREVRRFLRDQKWLSFDQPMAEIDPEMLAAYKAR